MATAPAFGLRWPGMAADAGRLDDEGGTPSSFERIAAIERAMNDLAPVAHLCWAAAAVDDYRLAGDVLLLIEVDGAGVVTTTIEADSTRDVVLTGCLRAVADAYVWPTVMRGEATRLPFAFTAPAGQFVIDRDLVPAPASGARVLLDGKNTSNRAASMFELRVPAGTTLAATASDRTEIWIYLDATAPTAVPAARAGDAVFLAPRAARAPAAPAGADLRVLIVSVPGGDEDATRAAGVLPASPAAVKDKQRPKPVVLAAAGVVPIVRRDGRGAEVGRVGIFAERATTGSDALAASRIDFDAGAVIPPHVHDGSTELLYVLRGRAEMVIDGVALTIGPTSVVQIPAGLEHSATITERLVAYQVYTPGGPEQRFKAQ